MPGKTRIKTRIRKDVLARDARFICVYCLTGRPTRTGKPVSITLDHVRSEARDGKTIATNLVKSCRRCNNDKHVTDLDLWAQQLERDTGLRASETQARVFCQMFATIPSQK